MCHNAYEIVSDRNQNRLDDCIHEEASRHWPIALETNKWLTKADVSSSGIVR